MNGRDITRRDFLDGVALGIGGAMALPDAAGWLEGATYPPALTGLRGSHAGSFEALHQLRDGTLLQTLGQPTSSTERYDLVVVGAGISGLTAAHRFRKERPAARILILDNHDDFGGHAKRNEFQHEGRTRIGYGGTQSIDSPLPYSPVAKKLVRELGIDIRRWSTALDRDLYRSLGLGEGFFFDRETFGADRLATGLGRQLDPAVVATLPLSETARRDLVRLNTEAFDPWPGLDPAATRDRLARISYTRFVTDVLGLDPGVLHLYQTRTHPLFGAGVDVVPAQDAMALGLPGFQGMKLDRTVVGPGQNYDSMPSSEPDEYYFHFPDGNASIARMLVRTLIPGAIPGSTMDDIVTARARYDLLDRPGQPVRIRLQSPAVRVTPGAGTGPAEIVYLDRGRPRSVRAGAVVLACWHQVIPHLCPTLPEAQRKALAFAIKVPLVYTNVFIRNWTAFQRLGVSSVQTPGFFHTSISLDFPVSVGPYYHSRRPEEPIVLHLNKSACKPGLPIKEQHRVGRTELFTTSFATIETNIRDQLARVLGSGGFDPGRDILGITVNRWPHGYAYQYNSLFDDFWLNRGEQPCEVARRPFGRITIANADAGAYSYTDAAIDHGVRAAEELLIG